jgi:hypothetical protein
MLKVDYSWAVIIVLLIIAAFLWKPISGVFNKSFNNSSGKQAYDRGKLVFYDTTRWGGKDSYKSCAMCHAADFKPESGKEIQMTGYVAGKPISLKGVGGRSRGGILDNGDELYRRIAVCINAADRIRGSAPAPATGFMKDLIAYVEKQ